MNSGLLGCYYHCAVYFITSYVSYYIRILILLLLPEVGGRPPKHVAENTVSFYIFYIWKLWVL